MEVLAVVAGASSKRLPNFIFFLSARRRNEVAFSVHPQSSSNKSMTSVFKNKNYLNDDVSGGCNLGGGNA